MGFKCGIVGLPNVGKSTIFNALTQAEIAAENYPFCTIEPNVGIVPVSDPRLRELQAIVNPQRVIPTTLEVVDIAGLVAGASKGEGLGNQFLGHIRETDAIAHVVRCFDDENVVHVTGKVDPLSDIEIIHTELAMADLGSVEKALRQAEKGAKGGDKNAAKLKEVLDKIRIHLDQGEPVRSLNLGKDELEIVAPFNLLTLKPTLYIANVSEKGLAGSDYLDQIKDYASKEGSEVVSVCAAIEAEIAQLPDEEKGEFLSDLGLTEPGLDRVVRAGHRLLGLQTFFTVGPKEVRAWTIPAGLTAPATAGKIHSDFEKGFIRAEVIAYDDYVAFKGEQSAKEAGKWRLEGKDYIVREGDVIFFRFNV